MLPLRDPHVRLVLLSHLATCAADGAHKPLEGAGLRPTQVAQLRDLSAVDLIALASQPTLAIAISFELERLEGALRLATRLNEARWLEAYFIRNGASARMMRSLFKSAVKVTYRRRREYGYSATFGRPRLPGRSLRDRIVRTWYSIRQSDPRTRYYLLHRAYAELSMAALEAVILADEGA